MVIVSPPKVSGTKVWAICTADTETELARLAEKLHEQIHRKGHQPPHLDLNEHKRQLALAYGAVEVGNAGFN